MRLEVGGGVGDDREAHRVALVETVGGEALELAEDLAGGVGRDTVGHRLGHEGLADGGHLLPAAIAGHGAAEHVGLGGVETGHQLCHPQHLLLVEDDAVGVGQRFGHGGVGEGDGLDSPTPVDERPYHLRLQRSGAIEGDGGDDVVEGLLLEPGGQVALTGRLQLE